VEDEMPVKVNLPTPLRRMAGHQSQVEVEAATVAELLERLEASYPGMGEKLLDETGAVRKYINLYVNDEDMRFLEGQATRLQPGDTVSIVPAIAGGR
jgi:molybdopterin synthase sulfur carrier subunit